MRNKEVCVTVREINSKSTKKKALLKGRWERHRKASVDRLGHFFYSGLETSQQLV